MLSFYKNYKEGQRFLTLLLLANLQFPLEFYLKDTRKSLLVLLELI